MFTKKRRKRNKKKIPEHGRDVARTWHECCRVVACNWRGRGEKAGAKTVVSRDVAIDVAECGRGLGSRWNMART